MKKKICAIGILFLSFISISDVSAETSTYRDPNADINVRIDDLIGRMSLKEKLFQLSQTVNRQKVYNPNNKSDKVKFDPRFGSVMLKPPNLKIRNALQKEAVENTRLGIPIIFADDVIHGFRTVYPIGLGQGASWNPNLVRKNCAVAAKEAWLTGLDWTFSPMIDVARDSRWGRVAEGYGEDQYLTSRMCEASVKGFQGEGPKSLSKKYTIAACLKHYAGYSYSLAGRDYACTEISRQTLEDTILPPYKSGIDAGAQTIMTSFNDINGVPAVANKYLLTDVLRKRWNFDGLVVSDWLAVKQLVNQRYAEDRLHAGTLALKAGNDMDMLSGCYMMLNAALKKGLLTMSDIDRAVRRVLRVKFRLGLFEHPYREVLPDKERYLKKEYRSLAKKLAQESFVLLKNNNSILPLNPDRLKKVAVIGPFADNAKDQLGCWNTNGHSDECITYLDALKRYSVGENIKIEYSIGTNAWGIPDPTLFREAEKCVEESDVTLMFLGEPAKFSGENASRSNLQLLGGQLELLQKLSKKGKPIVLLLTNGRPLSLEKIIPKVDAVIELWEPGSEGGPAVVDVLFGKDSPSGKLPITFPRNVGQEPIFYNTRNSSRPNLGKYRDAGSSEPMFPFGYGLSYSQLKYSEIQTPETVSLNQPFTASVNVSNTGKYDVDETVIWYLSDMAASVTQPIKKVIYFEKKSIPAGKTVKYTFNIIPERDLSFINAYGKKILEPGTFILHAGHGRKKHFTLMPDYSSL